MKIERLGLLAAAIVLGGAAPALAEFDQEILMKWAAATKVRYEIVGEFDKAGVLIINEGTNGYADVVDRVELQLIYDQTGAGLVGAPTVTNFPSESRNVRNGAEGCTPPEVTAPYEHYTILKVENGYGGALHLTTTRTHAAGKVTAVCTGKSHAVPAKVIEELEQFAVPAATLLALAPGDGGSNIETFPQSDTIVVKDNGWTWTYKLTPVD